MPNCCKGDLGTVWGLSSGRTPSLRASFCNGRKTGILIPMSTRKILGIAVLFAMMAGITMGQHAFSNDQIGIYDGSGQLRSIENIVDAMETADVVFLGELHDDAVAHAVQLELFRRATDRYLTKRPVVLSLEMFERDVQTVVNEYLAGLISENHFMLSSRPWGNYRTDYRPLVELAKEKKLPVVAANAPRRYVNMVSRGGRATLSKLSKEAKKWLPPLPYAEASDAYARKFRSLMGTSAEAQMGLENILSSQSLWDASMAYWIYKARKANKTGLVLHLNGSFHTENRLGTVEHLLRYDRKARVVVVTMRPEENFRKFDHEKHKDIGDFVILTDTKVPRSKR
jgi:uncharacterized iron-regulated protein